jgi:hypothetical protein
MPQIAPAFLDTVIYLYRSKAEAEEGKDFGGTGFLTSLPDETYPDRLTYFYAVTNQHVACTGGYSIIRLNTKDGAVDILEFGPEEWLFLPEYDIAIIPLPFDPGAHRVAMLSTQNFVTRDMFAPGGPLGVGSDVFMIGRFIDHDGGQTNRPAARFGHVSVLPAPIIQPNKVKADSFCIDMHSRTGHSGSPVFIYRTPQSEIGFRLTSEPGNYLGLLGIHWGQFPELWEIGENKQKTAQATLQGQAENLILEGQYVKGLSGMACVLPAWAILEVLKMPKITRLRRENTERVWKAKFDREELPPVAESNGSSGGDANPNHP